MTGFLSAIILAAIVPLLTGSLYSPRGRERFGIGLTWAFGWITMLGLFYPLGLFAIQYGLRFSLLCRIYSAVLLIVCICAGVRLLRGRVNVGRCIAGSLREVLRNPWMWLVLAFVTLFVLRLVFFARINYSDDDTYTTMVNDILTSDRIFYLNERTGEPTDLSGVNTKYQFMIYLPFLAFFAKSLHVHPAILISTLSPLVLMPLYYIGIWHLAGRFWTDKDAEKKRVVCVLLVMALNECGWATWSSTLSMYLSGGLWFGKAYVQLISIPFFLYFFLRWWNGKKTAGAYILGGMIALAAYAASLMGVVLLPVEIALLAGISSIQRRTWRGLPYAAVLILPAVLVCGSILLSMLGR